MKQGRLLPALIFGIVLIFFAFGVVRVSQPALSISPNVVISEIQVIGQSNSDDEFVELYNPTSDAVNLSGWRLTRKTSGGSQSNLVSSLSGTIAAHGYFLIAHPEYTGSVSPDLTYSATTSAVATNNTVLLYGDAGATVVDLVGMGDAGEFESTTAANPVAGGSIERKPGDSDPTAGNGTDTDNNGNDFSLRDIPEPQNSDSQIEPEFASPAPSATPIVSPSPEPSPTPSATPTVSPSPVTSPSPSATPSATPTSSPTPTASPVVSPTPTPTPSPTLVPSATPSPSPTMTPSPSPVTRVIFSGFLFRCYLTYRPLWFGNTRFSFPSFTCVHF